jgi:UTP--glucose-1-phosphate uridylyltransferase
MHAPVRKAVFPVGGLGTRFLPATKSVPKEMLTVVDRPLIHYAFEEARKAGIEEFIFVTAKGKTAIADYFDRDEDLERALESKQKLELLAAVRDFVPEPGRVTLVRQQQPLGLGHAIWCARNVIGNEPFAVLLPDDLVLSERACLAQLMDQYHTLGGHILGVVDVPREQTSRYGILDVASDTGRQVKARGLVEKPAPEAAPSTVSVFGRYILQPSIFTYLETKHRGSGGEIQLTDAIASDIGKIPVHGVRFDGVRYDCGTPEGFIEANLAFALANPALCGKVQQLIEWYAAQSIAA